MPTCVYCNIEGSAYICLACYGKLLLEGKTPDELYKEEISYWRAARRKKE